MLYQHKDGIYLVKADTNDLEDLYQLKMESWWGTHKALITNMTDQKRWIETIPADQLFMIARSSTTKEGVGVAVYTDIDWVNRSLNISGSIYQGQRKPDVTKSAFAAGLDFAFEILNMRRLGAEVLEFNRPAQSLEIDFLGFKVEGRKRQAVYRCGRYYDSFVLGLLREEWSQQSRVLSYGGSCNKTFKPELADYCCKKVAAIGQ